MAKYGVIESINMLSTHYGEHILDALVAAETENGSVGYVEGGEFKVFTAETLGKRAVTIVDQVPWNYDECKRSNQARSAFVNAAGSMVRARVLGAKDKFGLTAEALVGTPEVGKYVAVVADSAKLNVVAEAEGALGKIVASRKFGEVLQTAGRVYGVSDVMYEIELMA